MKRILVFGIIAAVLSSLVIIAIPTFAHDPSEEGTVTATEETWRTMYEACEEGDWQAMAEAAQEVHEDFGYANCYDEYLDSEASNPGGWGGMMSGYMHDGMMGW